MNSPPMLMLPTLETSSRPSHFQYTHTSPATSTREENLLEGTLPGRIIVLRLLELSWPTKRAEVYIPLDRKSTRLNSSHVAISYAVFCLKKKNNSSNTSTRLSETGQLRYT